MPSRVPVVRLIPFIVWILALSSIPVWNAVSPGMDLDAKVYFNAIHSLQAGHDPYLDGIATLSAQDHTIYPYIYPPLTLPLLRLIGSLPSILYTWGFWLTYGISVLIPIWVGMQMTQPNERRFFAYIAPAAPFFPGMIQEATLMCGNVAYVLYGLIFAAAYPGWRRKRWLWFYLAVLAASCVKITMLSLLAIPVLSARKQWISAGMTAASGVALFVMQLWIWPSFFHNFLHALNLEFNYKHTFGVAPAGLASYALLNAGRPYTTASMMITIVFVPSLFCLLLYLSRQFHAGKFSQQQWVPVMVTGVILLSPRVLEYDFAPLTLFMALILWRALASVTSSARAIAASIFCFAVLNVAVVLIAPIDPTYFYLECIQGFLLVGIFAVGCWNLLRQTRNYNRRPLAGESFVTAAGG